jgi:hypothetical protein
MAKRLKDREPGDWPVTKTIVIPTRLWETIERMAKEVDRTPVWIIRQKLLEFENK